MLLRHELVVRMETLQRDGLRTLFNAAPPAVAQELGIQVAELGSALYLACRAVPGIQFNKIMGFGVDGTITTDQLDLAVRWLRDVFRPGTLLMVPPLDVSPDLGVWLTERGLVRSTIEVAVFGLPEVVHVQATRKIDVRPVSLGEAASFGTVIAEALGKSPAYAGWPAGLVGQPSVTAYLAYDGITAVGGAALFTQGDWGWLFLAGTKPGFRNRGVQTALLARRISDARSIGVRHFSVEVLKPRPDQDDVFASYRNMQRLGFELIYERPNYVLRQPEP